MDPRKLLEAAWRPHPGQRAFLEADAPIRVLACGRRWGKTDACAAEAVLNLLGTQPTRQLVVAPTLDQARLLFQRALDLLEAVPGPAPPKVRWTPYPALQLGPHRLAARSGHVARALRGNEATHIVVDEAAFVPEELVADVLMPMLATTDGRLTLISTPKGRNHFWRFFRMGEADGRRVWSRRAPSRESPLVSREFLEAQRSLISDRAFRVEYEAEFVDSEGRVFPAEAVDRCLVAELPREPEAPFWAGVDWGRYGDATALAVVCGNREEALLLESRRIDAPSWAAQVEEIRGALRPYPGVRVLCDSTGLGDPMLEALRRACPNLPAEGFVFTAASKLQLIDNLALLFDRGALSLRPDPELLRELEHFEARTAASGHRRLGAAGGYHDDLVCALALAAWRLPQPYRPTVLVGEPRRFSVPPEP
ncbi:MAG: hypothetical protein N2109_04115 [Fimbriimonadales bacterium]|nr:hypothetical protein [Fimbriimonadales bacterium]